MMEESEAGDRPLFRTSKKRKVFRRRTSSAGDDGLLDTIPTTAHQPSTLDAHEDGRNGDREKADEEDFVTHLASQAAIRRPRPFRSHRGGIAFSVRNSPQPARMEDEEGGVLVKVDEQDAAVDAAMQRFAPQTGQVEDPNDRHMTAYVDAAIARMRGDAMSHTQKQDTTNGSSSATERAKSDAHKHTYSATQGKLQEVDLGPDAAARNIARTEAATRRLRGGTDTPADDDTLEDSPRKSRVGRDGKPFRRKRQRRTSDDVRRDELVDSIMRENRLELYDDGAGAGGPDEGVYEPTDEHVAEQFKQDFMDAVQTRNRELANRKPPTSNAGPRGSGQTAEPKGPKLGGSRNVRAAMRAKEIAAGQRGSAK